MKKWDRLPALGIATGCCPKCGNTQGGYPFTNCKKCGFWRVCRSTELRLTLWTLPEKERRKITAQGPMAMQEHG